MSNENENQNILLQIQDLSNKLEMLKLQISTQDLVKNGTWNSGSFESISSNNKSNLLLFEELQSDEESEDLSSFLMKINEIVGNEEEIEEIGFLDKINNILESTKDSNDHGLSPLDDAPDNTKSHADDTIIHGRMELNHKCKVPFIPMLSCDTFESDDDLNTEASRIAHKYNQEIDTTLKSLKSGPQLSFASREYLKKYNLDNETTRILDIDRIQMLPKLPANYQ